MFFSVYLCQCSSGGSHLRACIQSNRRPFLKKDRNNVQFISEGLEQGCGLWTEHQHFSMELKFPLTSIHLILCTKVTDIMDRTTGLPPTTRILCLICNQEKQCHNISRCFFIPQQRSISNTTNCKSTELCMKSRFPCLSLLYVFSLLCIPEIVY